MRRRPLSGGGSHSFRYGAPAGPPPDSSHIIRTFNSEATPTRPLRPSPLAASGYKGMPLDFLDRLRTFPLFAAAPESFLQAVASHVRCQAYSPRDYIITEGDEAKAMYWLVKGTVAVTSRDGEAQFAELKPGAFFGEIGVLMNIPRTATIIARTKCLLVALAKDALQAELPNYPEVEKAIRDEAHERLAILNRKKTESLARAVPQLTSRRSLKRAREGKSGEVKIGDEGILGQNGITSRKRKSPSPDVAVAIDSSVLGRGMVNVRQLLRELPLFSTLPPHVLHFVGLNAQPVNYPPFANILVQDSPGRDIFFIVRGEVEVLDRHGRTSAEGRENQGLYHNEVKLSNRGTRIKARLKQGQYFGEVASLSLAPVRTATVRSITSVECLKIPGDVLEELWGRCPPEIKRQVEETARQRMQEKDIIMHDVNDSASNSIERLEISKGKSKPMKSHSPTVQFENFSWGGSNDMKGFKAAQVRESVDPDPFGDDHLDDFRSVSRRASLAPPKSDEEQRQLKTITRSQSVIVRRPSVRSNLHTKTPPWPPDQGIEKRRKLRQRSVPQYAWTSLPDHILSSIFKYLDLHYLMRLRLVSSQWSRVLSTSPELLTTLDLKPYNRLITDRTLTDYICPFVGHRPFVIDLSNCFHISDDGFNALYQQCGDRVTIWRMKSVWDITGPAILEMANHSRDLEEIDLSNCRKVSDNLLARVIGWVVTEPMRKPSPNPRPPQMNGTRRGHLTTGSPSPTAASVAKTAQQHLALGPPAGTVVGCPRLRKLALSYCKHITDRTMSHIANHAASRMEEIDLTRCTTITDQGFHHWGVRNFSNLRKLCLADCTYLTDNAIIYLTNAAKGLRELDLVSLHLISSPSLPCSVRQLQGVTV